MGKKYDSKNFDLYEWNARKKKNKLFRAAAIFLVFAILIGGLAGVWSTGVIQKAIYNSEDLPDYVAYIDHKHSYTKTVVEPTCTEQGYTLYECRYCDMSYMQDYTATIDHDYQEVVLEQATTTSYGKAELVCSMCGDVKYEITLPLVGHTFTSEVVEPTCTEEGYTIHRSTDTDDMYIDEVIPATGHSMRLRYNFFYCETCGVKEYIEDCVAYGMLNGAGYVNVTSCEFWYADSNGVLYLAGDKDGASNFNKYSNKSDVESYTKVVYLDTVTCVYLASLPDTVTEVTFLADNVCDYYNQTSGIDSVQGCGDFEFPDGVEKVVIDGDYKALIVSGLGIKSLTISGNIEYIDEIICPSLEEIELGEGIENICGYLHGYDYATLNLGKVEAVVFPHSVKYVYLSIETYSREYLAARESDSRLYDFDWSAYYSGCYTWDSEASNCYYETTYGEAPEDYLWVAEKIENGDCKIYYDNYIGWDGTVEGFFGYTYEECVTAYEAFTAYMAELEATFNDKPIFVFQEGTESVKFIFDWQEYDDETKTMTLAVEDMILFLPSTIKSVYFTEATVYNNVTIYYAGSQTDFLTVVDPSSILVNSGWRDCVICNAEYSGQ